MRVLLTGGSGLLGSEISRRFSERGVDFMSPARKNLDVTDQYQVAHWTKLCDLVVHCAAMVDVDLAESQPAEAYRVNTIGTALLAQQCSELRIPMVFISSDYVFSGGLDDIYDGEVTDPINVYGITKAAAEQAVEHFLPDKHIIIRTSSLYGRGTTGYVPYVIKSLLALAAKKDSNVFLAPIHRLFQPTSARLLATTIANMVTTNVIGDGLAGVYHATGSGIATHLDVSLVVKNALGLQDIEIIPDSSWRDKTPRPWYSTLGNSIWNHPSLTQLNDSWEEPWQSRLYKELPEIISYVKERMP